MKRRILPIVVTILSILSLTNAKIMRNNALMTKMVSNFRSDNDISIETEIPKSILSTMQKLLCKNFPSVPCNLITKDETLKMLIERSIQQIDNKKTYLAATTQKPGYLTMSPVINSEDISNFIEIKENKESQKIPLAHKFKNLEVKRNKRKKTSKKSKQTSFYNRKKIRKFYPHKVKYKDKTGAREEIKDHSDGRLSMSVEVPDMTLTKKHQHFSYKMEPEEPPVWRIDYMKHEEPSVNFFDFNNALYKGSKRGAGDTERRDVLHSDILINKNYVGKKVIGPDLNSDGIE